MLTPFQNTLIKNKIDSLLKTKLEFANYMSIDTSLVARDGMKIDVHTYTSTGDVEKLQKGEGNTQSIVPSFKITPYQVGLTQGRFPYHDEDALTDSVIIEAGVRGVAEKMVNAFVTDAVAEFGKATLTETGVVADAFDVIVDATMNFGEDESGLFLLINPALKGGLRKALKDSLEQTEGYVRTGYIGSVNGIPVIVSAAVPDKTAFLATRDAVTLFTKTETETEDERTDANTRLNTLYLRRYYVVALTDETKVVKITFTDADTTPAPAPATTDGYTLLDAAPQNWSTNYNDYYTYMNNSMIKNAFSSVPTFKTDKFYSKD